LICYYNAENHIYGALESLLSQGKINIELILVDNNSTDRSSEIINDFLLEQRFKLKSYLFSIKRITEKRQGLAFARNSGFNQVTGKFVYILDSDNRLIEGVLPVIVHKLNKIDADCFLLKNRVLVGDELSYKNRFDDFWQINDFMRNESELTPIFAKRFIENNRYFELSGVTSELPMLLYLRIFQYGHTMYGLDVYGQIYDNREDDHKRISTAGLFTNRAFAGMVQRYVILRDFIGVLPSTLRIKYKMEYYVFFVLCLYLNYSIAGFDINDFFTKTAKVIFRKSIGKGTD
jgi:glycosyltransferase involved in cell wall biosynthesis